MISEPEAQKVTLDKGVSGSIFVIITLFSCCHGGTHRSHFGKTENRKNVITPKWDPGKTKRHPT